MTERKNPFATMPRCGGEDAQREALPADREQEKREVQAHGGRAGAPSGERNGAWRHGGRSKEAMAQRKAIRELLREARQLLRRDD